MFPKDQPSALQPHRLCDGEHKRLGAAQYHSVLQTHLVVLHAQGNIPVPPGEGAGVGGDAAEDCNTLQGSLTLKTRSSAWGTVRSAATLVGFKA